MDAAQAWSIAGTLASFSGITGAILLFINERRKTNLLTRQNQTIAEPEAIRARFDELLATEREQTALAVLRQVEAETRESKVRKDLDEVNEKLDSMRAIHHASLDSIDTLQFENHQLKQKNMNLEEENSKLKRNAKK